MRKILIIGGTGLIGRKVVDILSKNNEVFVLSRKIIKSKIKNVNYINIDIIRDKILEGVVSGKDVVVHLAGFIQGYDKEVWDLNVNGTENLVNACLANKVKRFVFVSSDVVFQKHKSVYSESKKQGEKLVKQITNYCILRPTIVYGRNDKINLGKIINFLKKWPLLLIPGSGTYKLQPVHVDDVAKYISIAAVTKIKGSYVIAGGEVTTFNGFIDKVCKTLNVRRMKIHIPLIFIIPLVKIFEKIMPQIGLNVSQIKNMCVDRIYNMSKTIKIFSYRPVDLNVGLKLTLLD